MNRQKRIVIVIGTVFIVLLMISSATAVPQINSEYVIKRVKHVEQKQRLLSSIKSYLSNLEGCSEYDKSDEFLKSIESDNIQDFLQNKDLNNIYDSEKIQKFVNSETFKHFTSSDFVQTLLNNNYSERNFNPWDLIAALFAFIFGLITWGPVIIFVMLIAIPMILIYSITVALIDFSTWSNPTIFLLILSIITGIVYAISVWLQLFIPAIIWPFYLAYYFFSL